MHRVILHLDMDAFYASIEQRDNPLLQGKPVIVGAPPTQRGVVSAASYEARRFGVRSAMPSVTAARLCPKGVFIRPRMDAYREESRAIMSLVTAIAGERIQQVSVDEAYVDVSETCQADGGDESLARAEPLARDLKSAIQDQRRLTATVGIAANKLLAKLASDYHKPDGLTLVRESEKVAFLRPLSVRVIHGVGQVTEQQLLAAGLKTVGDIQGYAGDLRAIVGNWGPELRRFAMGEDDRPLDLSDEIKSISSETTFLRDTDDRPVLRASLKEQAAEIAAKLEKNRLGAGTVQVKVRYSDFTTLTRQISVETPVSQSREIYRVGCWLLAHHKLVNRPLRLIGLGVSGLTDPEPRQLVLPLKV
ncbi:MAG: DNA polymerase IV [Verrucomicrobia bacterium]|nr:DNA polymerase IV [Verrucomicrobiota bacterium]MBI3870483.1 DNA polymerase IV [Verrucomicrobiota bacterium]